LAEAHRSRTGSSAPPRHGRKVPRTATFRTASDCGTLSDHLCGFGNRKITECPFPEPLGMCPVSPVIIRDIRLGIVGYPMATKVTDSIAQLASEGNMRKLNALLVLCFALLLASTVHGQTGVNNAEMNGSYAFTFTGISGNGTVSSVYGAVGRFTADGAGNVTNGELDTNTVGGGAVAQTFTGTYSIGADNRGVMTLSIGARLAFAMVANGNAQFIKFDASGGAGTIGSGTMEKSDTTAYSTARITGDYAFGAAGFDNANNRAAIEGRFTSNGTGALANAAGDLNGYGTDYPMTFTAANYTVSNAATGRG